MYWRRALLGCWAVLCCVPRRPAALHVVRDAGGLVSSLVGVLGSACCPCHLVWIKYGISAMDTSTQDARSVLMYTAMSVARQGTGAEKPALRQVLCSQDRTERMSYRSRRRSSPAWSLGSQRASPKMSVGRCRPHSVRPACMSVVRAHWWNYTKPLHLLGMLLGPISIDDFSSAQPRRTWPCRALGGMGYSSFANINAQNIMPVSASMGAATRQEAKWYPVGLLAWRGPFNFSLENRQ